jgi:hypothetical protein
MTFVDLFEFYNRKTSKHRSINSRTNHSIFRWFLSLHWLFLDLLCFVWYISFRFVILYFVSFRFFIFRFVSLYFVSFCDTSFRFVSFLHFSFRFVVFRFISFRFVFVSQFSSTLDGLQLALIIFGLIQRFQTPSNFELDEHYIYSENLGFYACSSIQTKSNFDFAIFKLCPGQLDYSNQNGRPKKKQLEQRKVNSPSKFCFICTILLSGDVHMNPGPMETIHPNLLNRCRSSTNGG